MEFSKIKKQPIKITKYLWQNLWLILILLLLSDLILGGILFLKYHPKQEEMPPAPSSLKINQTLLDKVSAIFQDKETFSEQIDQNQYPDLFRISTE